jgi:hypothetical protein
MKPRKANIQDAMNRVTAGDVLKFQNGDMTANEQISFLADMVLIGNDRPTWRKTYNEQEPFAEAIIRAVEDGHIDADGNVLQWWGTTDERDFTCCGSANGFHLTGCKGGAS